tara:strand:- start:840 stop:1301 length:462 start_codon:yes stop_codon:yes gene_type:complete
MDLNGEIPTISLIPKKTFLGLDKSPGHCFTVPKKFNQDLIGIFDLGDGRLQTNIDLVIDDGSGLPPSARRFPAIIRLVRINRSRPYKLKAEDLPKREVIQIVWKNFELTQSAIRVAFSEAFEQVSKGEAVTSQKAIFTYVGDGIFEVISSEID